MNRSSTAALCALLLAFPAMAHARASNGYLSWAGKTPVAAAPAQPVQQVHTAAGDYSVPPSPYGQVGDPYARALGWPAKQGQQAQAPQQVAYSQPPRSQPVQSAPVQAASPATSYMVMPRETAPPAPVQSPTYSPAPQALAPQPPLPQAQTHAEDRPDPGADDDAGGANERAPERHADAPQMSATHAPQPVAAAQPAAPKADEAAPDTGDYHVPSSSPYAARIAAARAAQERDRAAQVQAQANAQAQAASQAAAQQAPAPAKGAKAKKAAPVATAPAPSLPLAAAETEHIFVPGQHYTSAADEPRVYSLHRQYGLTPDPITVDPHPTGALLGDPITKDDAEANDDEGSDTGVDSDAAAAAAARTSSSKTSEH